MNKNISWHDIEELDDVRLMCIVSKGWLNCDPIKNTEGFEIIQISDDEFWSLPIKFDSWDGKGNIYEKMVGKSIEECKSRSLAYINS